MTIFNVRGSDLDEVASQLRRRYVNFDELHPSNSLKWLMENKRDFAGFVDLDDVGINQKALVFLRGDALLRDEEPANHIVGIRITAGSIVITMKPEQLEFVGLIHDEQAKPYDPELIPVSEVIFKG